VDAIGIKRSAILYGSADLRVVQVSQHNLKTEAVPLPQNANHAHITGWPSEKPAQKSIAQQLAAVAKPRKAP